MKINNRLHHHVFFLMALAIVSTMILITGCDDKDRAKTVQYVVNTAQLAQSLTVLDTQLDGTQQTIQSLQNIITQNDYVILQQTAQDVLQLRKHLQELIQRAGGLDQFLINAEQVYLFYLKGGESYTRARAIITTHWEQLPLETQEKLMAFDGHVQAVDVSLQYLVTKANGSDITKTLSDVITISAATAKLLALTGVL